MIAFLTRGLLAGLLTGMVMSAHAAGLTLIYSGNLNGELEPCGCSEEGNLGGIQRRYTLLAQLRAQHPGAIVISSGGLLQVEGSSDRIKSDAILRGFAALNYDAIGMQWRDLAYGPEFLQQQNLPWVVSNWHDASIAAQRVIQREGQTLRVFSWLDPAASPLRKMRGDHDVVTPDVAALQQALADAKARGELTLLTADLSAADIEQRLGLAHVDILVQRSGYEVYAEPMRRGRTLVLTPGSRGMRLGVLSLTLSNGGIADWRHVVRPMPASIPNPPQLAAWYQDYNDAVKAEFIRQAAIKQQQAQGESPFAGAQVCQGCHAGEHDTWSASKHARAFEALEAVNKGFDPYCVVCHVVGFGQPGGYADFAVTGHLQGVQCENCHGAARAHAQSAGRIAPANQQWTAPRMCAQCHDQPHSPAFQFDNYWPRIRH